MFPAKCPHSQQMSAGRITAILALVLLPFPVSIPLALWLTGCRRLPDHSGLPASPSHKDSSDLAA